MTSIPYRILRLGLILTASLPLGAAIASTAAGLEDVSAQADPPKGRAAHAGAPVDTQAVAQESDSVSGAAGALKLSDAIALALAGNPSLAVFSWELRAAEARRIQAGARPNPEIVLGLENVSGDLPGLSQSELTVSLGQVLELGGKRAARIRASRAEEGVRSKEWEILKLSVSAEVTRLFIDAVTADGLVALQEEEVRIADQVRVSVGQKVLAGAISPAERLRAEHELRSSQLELRDLEEERSLSYARLGSSWGETDGGELRVAGSLDSARTIPSRESLMQRIEESPELAARASEIASRQTQLALARAERAPDLEIEVGYRRLQGEDANTFVGALTLPLPLFNRNEGGIAVAEAEARGAQAKEERARTELARSLAESHSLATRAGSRARVLRDEIVPNAERTFEEIRAGYEQGRFSYVDLLEARRSWTQARRERLRALSEHHLAITELELLLGGALHSPDSSLEGSKP